MEDALYLLSQCNLNEIQAGFDPYEKDVVIEQNKYLLGVEDLREMDHFYQAEKGLCFSKYQQPISNYCMLDDFKFSAFVSSIQQPVQESSSEISDFNQAKKEGPYSSPFGLLGNCGSGFNKLKGQEKLNFVSNTVVTNMCTADDRKLSAEEIMKVAGARYIEFSAERGATDLSMLMHPFGLAFSGLSDLERWDVELAQLLLSAAEKVGCQQFDGASRLLSGCELRASNTGNPVQRIVFYFAAALGERIDRETGGMPSRARLVEKGRKEMVLGLSSNLTFIETHRELPFNQVVQFTGIQTIIENVASASKIHLIDFGLRSGVQWTVLMQGLAERDDQYPVKQLKITAVGTTDKHKMEEVGKRLESIAKSFNLNFSFKAVSLANMKDLKKEHFAIEADEVVAVYSPFVLRTMISTPYCLETVLGVINKLNPSIMVVTEVEANHNSPSFVNRFIELLFYYSAFFDCLEACMDEYTQNRMSVEQILGEGIRNAVATEGEERFIRNVKIDVWRAFFERFRMVEIEISESSLYQASLVAKEFVCGNSCTLDTNGKCLIVGWKGSPILSVSAWKFF